jgi:hypothetical protein
MPTRQDLAEVLRRHLQAVPGNPACVVLDGDGLEAELGLGEAPIRQATPNRTRGLLGEAVVARLFRSDDEP